MSNQQNSSISHIEGAPFLSSITKRKTDQIAIVTIIGWQRCDEVQPLYVKADNGMLFKCGGLSERQRGQLPALMPDLINTRMVLVYKDVDEGGIPVKPIFKTLLLNNDTRPSALRLLNMLDSLEGAVQ